MSNKSKSGMPGYYGHTQEASAEQIADAAMRAYGHPWHARNTLLAHRRYLAEVGVREPAQIEGALELLEQRASGKATVTERSVYSGTRTRETEYNIGATLDAWGAPYARSGVRDLCECEQREYEAWAFGRTLARAWDEIADALYAMQVVEVETKSGAKHYAWLGEAEQAMRARSKVRVKLTLRDASGKELEDKRGNLRELAASNVKRIEREGTFSRYYTSNEEA